ncbi:MAG: hypothetical protein JSV74_07040 [Dehalococcoidia bacterium]|nr:MAG: hypothetical protein JSV74_07040 [Dehalococcoidia bacterium]
MSRFIDKLRQLSQTESQPMGFRREKFYSKPRLMLVVEIGTGVIELALEEADAVILPDIKKDLPKKLDIPVGIRLSGDRIGELPESVDFIIFQPESPVLISEGLKKGKVIAFEASVELDLLRSLNDLPLDALLISKEWGRIQESINWRYLMICSRLASLSNKPLLVAVSPEISQYELQLLWDVGVDGVVVTDLTAGGAKKLRSLIDELIKPSESEGQEIRAILPKLREEAISIADMEDDED